MLKAKSLRAFVPLVFNLLSIAQKTLILFKHEGHQESQKNLRELCALCV